MSLVGLNPGQAVKMKRPITALFGIRHVQVLLLFFGMVFITFMKVDMSIAIVAMTDTTQNNSFDWTHQRQSVILSSYKWGYVVSKIPGGELSSRFGGKVVMVTCAAVNFIFGLLLPTAASVGGWQAVCGCQLMQGLAQGLLLPTIHTLTGKWAPLDERSRFGSFLSSGVQLGTALEYILAGFLASYWGWQSIFYVNGIIVVIWTIIYVLLGSASPQDSKMISTEERLYIQSSLGQIDRPKRSKTPWKAMLTSLPFLTLIITHSGGGWGYWTLLTEMPTYLNRVLGVNIKANGAMSALPYLVSCLTTLLFGIISDYVLAKGWLSITACRKVSNSIGYFGTAIFMIVLSYTSDVTTAVALLTACLAFNSGGYTGYSLVHLDLAPNHAGTMMGITGFVSNLISTFAPIAAGYLIYDETLSSEWRKVFFLAAGVYIVSNTIFLIFGTSERQKWNDNSEEKDEKTDNPFGIEKQAGKVV